MAVRFWIALSEWRLFQMSCCFRLVWKRNLKSAHYYILTDFALLFESDVLEIHSLILPGLLLVVFLDRFPGSEFRNAFEDQ
jgi:hypothetical protein